MKKHIGSSRRKYICSNYTYDTCGGCPLHKPCMEDASEDDYNRNPEEFERKIDEWLDTEIEEGNNGE